MAPRVRSTRDGIATVELDDGSTIDVAEAEAGPALEALRGGMTEAVRPLTDGGASAPDVSSYLGGVSGALEGLSERMPVAASPLYGEALPMLPPER